MFLFAASGNVLYSASVIVRAKEDASYWLKQLPWLIGSGGTLSFDMIVSPQPSFV
jgi:hypothetical protein